MSGIRIGDLVRTPYGGRGIVVTDAEESSGWYADVRFDDCTVESWPVGALEIVARSPESDEEAGR